MPRSASIFVGEVYGTSSGDCVVTRYETSKKVHVKFLETGTQLCVDGFALKKGRIKDPEVKSLFGVACIGQGCFSNLSHKKAYDCWYNMLARCYQKKHPSYKNYGALGVKVCQYWLNFQNFCPWFYENYRQGFEIDKDIFGGKLYCEDNCLFIPKNLNAIMVRMAKGVTKTKSGKYAASVYCKGSKSFDLFDSYEDAASHYLKLKSERVMEAFTDAYTQGLISQDVLGKAALKVELGLGEST